MNGGGDDEDGLDMAAAEFVLGTLSGPERRVFAARLTREESVRRAVDGWERRLAALSSRGDEVAPSPELWERVAGAVRVAQPQPNAAASADEERPDAMRALLASRGRWRAATFGLASLAAGLLIAVIVAGLRSPGTEHRYLVAAVNRGGDKPALIIRVDLATRQVLVRPVAATAPAGRSLQLWAIAAGAAPRSMGLLGAAPADLVLPTGVGADTTFAVSVEPEGGSAKSGPTGPVIYAGQLIGQ